MLDAYREHAQGAPRRRPDGRVFPPRLACCGTQRHAGSADLLELGDGDTRRTQWAGVIRCRSKACPMCIGVRRSGDGHEVHRVALAHHDAFGLHVAYLSTFTVGHGVRDSLADTWIAVRAAWRCFISGRSWMESRARWSLGDFVVREEPTHGRNGWHPHMHVLFLPRRELTESEEVDIADWMFERWAEIVERVFRPLGSTARVRAGQITSRARLHTAKHAPLPGVGTDFRKCAAVEYVAKLGFEMAGDVTKKGRRGRTPLELLEAWTVRGDARALILYQTFERATKGKKDLTWSRSLRVFRDLAKSELRAEWLRERATARVVASVPGSVFDSLSIVRGVLCDIQDRGEAAGLAGVVDVVRLVLGQGASARVESLTLHNAAAAVDARALGLGREWFAG